MARMDWDDLKLFLAVARAVQVYPYKLLKDFTQNDYTEIRKAVLVLRKRACAVKVKSMFN